MMTQTFVSTSHLWHAIQMLVCLQDFNMSCEKSEILYFKFIGRVCYVYKMQEFKKIIKQFVVCFKETCQKRNRINNLS